MMIDKLVVLSTIALSSIPTVPSTLTYQNNITYSIEDSDALVNSVIQSPKFEKNIMMANGRERCINTSTTAYNDCGSDVILDEELKQNMKILMEFSQLSDNWDEYGAKAPSIQIITKVMEILPKLSKQPDIFPTPEGNIQLEYSIGRNRHLNIELLPDATMIIFEMFEDRTATKNSSIFEISALNKRIEDFYGRV
jgi:hypothetical protein